MATKKKDNINNVYKDHKQTLVNPYILEALTLPCDPEKHWRPLEDAVLLMLDDFFNKKINAKTIGDFGNYLYQLQYFTSELHYENPELFKIFDYLAVLQDPSVLKTKDDQKRKIEQTINVLQKYYENKKPRIEFLKTYFRK